MKISSATSDEFIRCLCGAGAYYISMVAFYIDIGQDMGAKYFLPLFLPIILALMLMQWATRTHVFASLNLPNLITALLWCSAFSLLYTYTYQTVWFMSLVSYDFIIGTAFFVFLTALTGLLASQSFVPPKIAAGILAALNFLLGLIPFLQYAYYVMVWHSLSPASLMSLYMTNWRESIDFIEANVGLWLIPLLGAISFLLYKAWKIHLTYLTKIAAAEITTAKRITFALLTVGAFYIAFIEYVPESSIAKLWNDVTDYAMETEEYGKRHDERFASLTVDKENALPAKSDEKTTVIVIIGESASRDYMRAFNPDFIYDDTPWLSSMADNPNFIIFTNAYSSWSQTVPSLQRALTEQSQYNGKDFLDSVSIVDAAKKADFTTSWFSNQGRYGQYDSITTLVAKTADRAEWTDDSYTFTDKYDIALLDYLKTVDTTRDNFIVLHLIGSHIYYYNRYPYDFAKWRTEDGTGMATSTPSYANSILYTDHVLKELYDYASTHLNLSAMIYFSDHGENLHISHNPDVFSFDMVRIPMFIYLSPRYRELCPEEARLLDLSRRMYFTNDMMYDTVCGIIGAKGNRYDARQDLSSADYAFTKDNLTTMLGERRIADDPKAE